jgi:hypothetical protein
MGAAFRKLEAALLSLYEMKKLDLRRLSLLAAVFYI